MHEDYDKIPQDINYAIPSPLEDDDPNNTEIRQVKIPDLATLELIDVKCQATPLKREQFTDMLKADDTHGILGVYRFKNVGFVMFDIQDNGNTVHLQRFSVAHLYQELGVYEKLIETLRTTLPNGPKPKLSMTVSEHDIDTDHFQKLLSVGFRGAGIVKDAFFEYNRVWGHDRPCDGILLELT